MQLITLATVVSVMLLIEHINASSYLRLFRQKRGGGRGGDNGDRDNGGGHNGGSQTTWPVLPPYPKEDLKCHIDNKDEILKKLDALLFCLGYKLVPLDAICEGVSETQPPITQMSGAPVTECPPSGSPGTGAPGTGGPGTGGPGTGGPGSGATDAPGTGSPGTGGPATEASTIGPI